MNTKEFHISFFFYLPQTDPPPNLCQSALTQFLSTTTSAGQQNREFEAHTLSDPNTNGPDIMKEVEESGME